MAAHQSVSAVGTVSHGLELQIALATPIVETGLACGSNVIPIHL